MIPFVLFEDRLAVLRDGRLQRSQRRGRHPRVLRNSCRVTTVIDHYRSVLGADGAQLGGSCLWSLRKIQSDGGGGRTHLKAHSLSCLALRLEILRQPHSLVVSPCEAFWQPDFYTEAQQLQRYMSQEREGEAVLPSRPSVRRHISHFCHPLLIKAITRAHIRSAEGDRGTTA